MTRQTTVRYGHLRLRGLFTIETDEELEAGDVCLVQSARGQELGTVLARPVGDRGSAGSVGCNTGACGSCASSQGTILRRASDEDRKAQAEQDRVGTRREVLMAREKVRTLGLDIRITDAEYLFQKEKLILQFTTEGRVDFRDLVKDLGRELSTRIELKQIGARDEARLVGDMASCGRELCCRSFLHDLQPVSMRMAKQQKKTLDPTKISGQCGKLKCCLRYEDEVYVELQKTLPRKNSWVRVAQGTGKVLSIDLLLQKMVLDIAGERELVHVSEVLESGLKPPKPGEARTRPAAGTGTGPAAPRKVTPLRLPTTGVAAEPSTPAPTEPVSSGTTPEPDQTTSAETTSPEATSPEATSPGPATPAPAREPSTDQPQPSERGRSERPRREGTRPVQPRGERPKRERSRSGRSRPQEDRKDSKQPTGGSDKAPSKSPSRGPGKSSGGGRSRRSRSEGEQGRSSGPPKAPPSTPGGSSSGSSEDARRRRRRRGRRGED